MNKNSIGIIGAGFVGQILKRYYPSAFLYDKDENKTDGTLGDLLKRDYIFLAINLFDNSLNSKEELEYLFETITETKVIIIKSTFIPSTCDFLQNKFPHLRFIYNPEFLTERTAWEDFTSPQFQILGMPHQTLHLAEDIFSILPNAPIKKIISPIDAETLKHAFNSYYALKVTFFNQLFDACGELGADYDTIREIMVRKEWVGDSHSLIWHKSYRGFGGTCLPKDTEALSKVANFPLLKQIIEYNDRLKNL